MNERKGVQKKNTFAASSLITRHAHSIFSTLISTTVHPYVRQAILTSRRIRIGTITQCRVPKPQQKLWLFFSFYLLLPLFLLPFILILLHNILLLSFSYFLTLLRSHHHSPPTPTPTSTPTPSQHSPPPASPPTPFPPPSPSRS